MARGKYYASPRWSGEILDCSMPMTLDTYSECSYRCLYCFAFFQKAVGDSKKYYLGADDAVSVNADKIINMFENKTSQFGTYIKKRIAMQWGGMADQFDENERKQGVTLKLLKYFRSIEYPISFSTKAVWWTEDESYVSEFKGAKHFNVKVSIITAEEEKAHIVEPLVPTPAERFKAIERIASWGIGGVTLRLRPYIIGLTDLTVKELLQSAADAGATAVSTEFMCLERRAVVARGRYAGMSKVVGFDLLDYYVKNTPLPTGYLRLNRKLKEPYVIEMQEECERLGLRLYVSDAHFKEVCANGSCCGLEESWNYSRGQFTEAILIAKEKGKVYWSDIDKHLDYARKLGYHAEGFNVGTSENEAKFHDFTMRDWMRWQWNNVNGAKSPYKYFGGVLYPIGKDDQGDVIYEYRA